MENLENKPWVQDYYHSLLEWEREWYNENSPLGNKIIRSTVMNPKQQFYKILLSYGLDVRVTQRDAQSSAFVSIYKVNEKADDVDRNLELLTRLKELPDFKYFAFRFKDRSGIERIVPVSSMSPRRGQWRETANGSKFWSATQLLAAVGANTLEFDIISLERDKLDVQETTVQPKNEIEVL